MKFIYEATEEENILYFSDVEENQFFIDMCGRLCQKILPESFTIIADADGTPCGLYIKLQSDRIILRMLPKVFKIEF